MLGPLVNPCSPPVQVVGVFNFELQRIYHFIFQQEQKQYKVVHNIDGYDEISLTAPAKICSAEGESLLHPEEMGFEKIKRQKLSGGGTVKDAAEIFQRILHNECTPEQRNVVIANTTVAVQCYHKEKSWDESKAIAEESLKSGSAKKCFEKLISMQP